MNLNDEFQCEDVIYFCGEIVDDDKNDEDYLNHIVGVINLIIDIEFWSVIVFFYMWRFLEGF